jgi:hypothetical protein
MVKLGGEARALGRQAGPDQQANQEHDGHDAAEYRGDGPGTTSAGPSEVAWTGAGAIKTSPIASDRPASPCRHVTGTCIAFT